MTDVIGLGLLEKIPTCCIPRAPCRTHDMERPQAQCTPQRCSTTALPVDALLRKLLRLQHSLGKVEKTLTRAGRRHFKAQEDTGARERKSQTNAKSDQGAVREDLSTEDRQKKSREKVLRAERHEGDERGVEGNAK